MELIKHIHLGCIECEPESGFDPQGGTVYLLLTPISDLFALFKEFISITFGWAAGIALAVGISLGISGGHINPAVSSFFAVSNSRPMHSIMRKL